MKWAYYTPIFESDTYNLSSKTKAWSGHTHFAYDLVRFMKPNTIVELGTHYGNSFFSFCQGVKDEHLSTTCFAIDTWKGDSHSGLYGNEVFETVKTIVTNHYVHIAKMIRATFDDALNLFEDESIDLLHIDGYHTYEAVSHDFETWLPKLSKKGIILFHDIVVKERDFGVYKLWDTVKETYPHFEFTHSHGLGVLFPKEYDEKFNDVFANISELQNIYAGNIEKKK